jgi:hypothetical protein
MSGQLSLLRRGPLRKGLLLLFVFTLLSAACDIFIMRSEIKSVEQIEILPSMSRFNFDPDRLCMENPYIPSLNSSLAEVAKRMDKWLDEETSIEKMLRADPDSTEHTHKRFEAFQAMAQCNKTCVGGQCGSDASKQVCGLDSLQAPCIVYSIGSNNNWSFENDVLRKTSCEVHTFDCTGDRSRFKVPSHERLHFHYACLGAKNKPARGKEFGDFWTLDKIQTSLNHSRIDLLKMDTEGYEWPIFHDWPLLTEIKSPSHVLPMQVLVEIHYKSQMKELAADTSDFKFVTDMVQLQSRLLKMGYATVVYDPNSFCKHCVELSLMRIRCLSPLFTNE